MTASNGEWKPFPDARDYEASHRGKIRSFKRDPDGLMMKLRPDADDYLRFNYTDDKGVRHHNVSVARTVLLAHDPGGYRPGMHACHKPGASRQDNRWPEILYWGTPDQNREEALAVRLLNNPPKVKPARTCPMCGKEHRDHGRRCHECVVELGVRGAQKLAGGMGLEKAAEELEYHPLHLFNLAVRYGGLRFVVDHAAVTVSEPLAVHSPSPKSWLRRVQIRWQAYIADSDGA